MSVALILVLLAFLTLALWSARRLPFPLTLVMWTGTFHFLASVITLSQAEWPGHADPAGYANMAWSLVQGRGLEVDTISWFFRAYDSAQRFEEHWPPLLSFLQVPFLWLLGKSALALWIPPLFTTFVALPLSAAFTVREMCRSSFASWLAGTAVLLHPSMRQVQMEEPRPDGLYATLVLLAVALTLRSRHDPRSWPLLGMVLGASIYAKGTGLLLMAVLLPTLLFFPSKTGLRPTKNHPLRRRALLLAAAIAALCLPGAWVTLPSLLILELWCRSRLSQEASHPWMGFVTASLFCALVALPWWTRNTLHFGSPLYSTQQHCSSYMGLKSWERGTYPLYWGMETPGLKDRFEDTEAWLASARQTGRQIAWWMFVAPFERIGRVNGSAVEVNPEGSLPLPLASNQPTTWHQLMGNLARWPLLGLWVLALITMGIRWCLGRPDGHRFRPGPTPWSCFLLSVVMVTHWAFLTFLWDEIDRLALPLQAGILCLGIASFSGLGQRVLSPLMRLKNGRHVLLVRTTLALTLAWITLPGLVDSSIRRPHDLASLKQREKGRGEEWKHIGHWLKENAPGTVTMTRDPWELHWFSEAPAVQIPNENLEAFFSVAQHFKAEHVVLSYQRRFLFGATWTRGGEPLLEPVFESGGRHLCKIHWDRVEKRFPALPTPSPWRRAQLESP